MNPVRFLASTAVLAVALAGCGGGGGGSAVPAQISPFNPTTSGIPSNLLVRNWGEPLMQNAAYVGPSMNAHLSIDVVVHQQNASGLAQYAQNVSNPASPNFRHFLTPSEIATRFGATQADYRAVAQYFVDRGLYIAGWNQRMMLTVSGGQAAMERAFGVTFGTYSKYGQTFVAPNGQPHFERQLPVDAVLNIVRVRPNHAYLLPGVPRAGAAYAAGYTPPVVRAAFDFSGAYSKGFDGNGIVVGIVGTGGIDTGGTSGDKNLDALAAATNTNVANVTQVPVTNAGVTNGLTISGINNPPGFPYSGDFASPPPVTGACGGSLPTCNPEDGEAQLDVQQAATLAPGANVYFYLAYNQSDCFNVTFPSKCTSGGQPMLGINEGDAEIQQAISDNSADVLSISYGGGETQQGFSPAFNGSYQQLEFAALASEGIAVFVSSGDFGSAECLSQTPPFYLGQQCVSYPSGDPSVTSVGGITASVDGFGNPLAPFVGWGISTNENNGNGYGAYGWGSGGGISTLITAPSWQSAAVPGVTMREQPDVSMLGDPSTGIMMEANAPGIPCVGLCDIGGTSVAAPEMAAMWADVLSACKAQPSAGFCAGGSGAHPWRLGNAAPYLYAIYGHTKIAGIQPSLRYSSVFDDILYGDNQQQSPGQPSGVPVPGYPAMTGYDLITGVGSPYAGHLIQAITGISVP